MMKKSFMLVAVMACVSNYARAQGIECRDVKSEDGVSGDVRGFSFKKVAEDKIAISFLRGNLTEERWSTPKVKSATCTYATSGFFLVDCTYDGVEHSIHVTRSLEDHFDEYGIVKNSEEHSAYYFFQDCKFI